MKYLLILLSFTLYGQNPNFIIHDNIVKWQFVYSDSLDINYLKSNPNLEFKTELTGYVKRTNFNNKKLNDQVSEFIIEKKLDRYRVTIFNIKIIPQQIAFSFGEVTSLPADVISIESVLIKNNQIRKSYLGYNLSEILHPHYLNLFLIKTEYKDEW